MSLGIKKYSRDEEAIAIKQLKNGKKGTERLDAADMPRRDDGHKVFGEENISTSMYYAPFDIGDCFGLYVSNVYVFQKERDNMGYLVISMNELPEGITQGTTFEEYMDKLDKDLAQEVDKIFTRCYEHVYIWINPNASITLNASHALDTPARTNLRLIPNPNDLVEVELENTVHHA